VKPGFFSFQCTYLSTPLLSPLTISFRNQTIGHFESPFITLYQVVVAYLFSTQKSLGGNRQVSLGTQIKGVEKFSAAHELQLIIDFNKTFPGV
jgi:hypothetical protein